MYHCFGLLLLLGFAGCINGAPLPPTPLATFETVAPARTDAQQQDADFIKIAQNYVRGQGQDPLLATYEVHRNPRLEEEPGSDESVTLAVVDVNFINSSPWHLAIKSDGDISQLSARQPKR
ncbi:MAG TPA: hypothetical protein VFI31_07430 [Pirellulales bacterium]|nr:hypothetical protein [Pirellulales bacterium]